MFCQRCGTKATTGDAHYCYECGAAIDARDQHRPGPDAAEGDGEGARDPRWEWRATFDALPFGRQNLAAPYALMKDHRARTLLSAVGLGTLLLLAVPILAGIVLLALLATALFVGALVHLAPVILIGLVVYWALSGRGPAVGRRRHQHYQV